MAKGWKEAMQVEQGQFMLIGLPKAGFCQLMLNTDIYQKLLRQLVIPGFRSWQKICFLVELVGWILDSGRLTAIFATRQTWTHWSLYFARFAGKSPVEASRQFGCHMCVHRCGMGPASSGIHLQDLSLPWRKMVPSLNRWTDNSPTHANQFFSRLT